MKVLTIALPTYNREIKILQLLDFLSNEFICLSDKEKEAIQVYISDNCSFDNTENVVKTSQLFTSTKIEIKYTKNSKNLGLLGNLTKLYSTTNSNYIWLMGDDDCYKPGIVKMVLKQCLFNEYSYIFINHSTIMNGKTINASVLKDLNYKRTDKEVIWDLYRASGTVMMFMSACVYKMDYVSKFISKYGVNLVTPCSLSFYCAAKGQTKIIKEPMIINDWTNISWTKFSQRVFYIQIPLMLTKMPYWGYSYVKCYERIFCIWSGGILSYIRHSLNRIIR